jgi:hypothetical protein
MINIERRVVPLEFMHCSLRRQNNAKTGQGATLAVHRTSLSGAMPQFR